MHTLRLVTIKGWCTRNGSTTRRVAVAAAAAAGVVAVVVTVVVVAVVGVVVVLLSTALSNRICDKILGCEERWSRVVADGSNRRRCKSSEGIPDGVTATVSSSGACKNCGSTRMVVSKM